MSDTSMLELLLWVVLPYVVLAVFVLGHIWRFRYDRFGWTTRSSQIYESKLLAIGSPLFHYGIIGIFFGHVVGLGIPKSWTRALGVSDHVYHLMAATIGLAAAVACVGGLLILLYRRRTNKRVFGATTAGDKLMYLFLAAVIVFGVLATIVETAFGTYDYREGVSIWFRNFWTLQPDPSLMSAVLPAARALGTAAVRDLAVHSSRARVRRPGRVPHQALYRLPLQGPPQGVGASWLGEGEVLMTVVSGAKPPVTSQDDWDSELLPWIRRVEAALKIEDCPMDVDRVHVMTGVVARDVQRSMAPISSFLVGYAMGRGAGLEEACRLVEDVTSSGAEPVEA